MRNSLMKVTVFAAATASVVATISATAHPAQAVEYEFDWQGTNGYSATGFFSYDASTAPTVITEANGAKATNYLQSLSVSFFDPSYNLLEAGSSVVNGVSSDSFFKLTFDSQTNNISVLDVDTGAPSYKYFLTNLRTPDGTVVGPGVTGFNFFDRSNADSALGSATSVQVKLVPEPMTVLGTLVVGGLGLALKRKKETV